MKYITYENVVDINKAVCDVYGTQHLVIKENELQSAIGVQQWYDNVKMSACAVLRSLVLNHPFRDGNKRTAYIAANYMARTTCSLSTAEQCLVDIASGNLKNVDDIRNILYGPL